MNYLDEKQQKIIIGWFDRAIELEGDEYASFISLWISFNAFCCAQYAEVANRLRADLKQGKGLKNLNSDPITAEGFAQMNDDQYKININEPGEITIVVSERYTEDIIFSKFAKDYQRQYEKLLDKADFREVIEGFQHAILKDDWEDDRHFVINMSKHKDYLDYKDKVGYKTLIGKNIVAPFEETENLMHLKDVLYQVRCNIFHGEKVPKEPNDDRIVKAAYPVLKGLMDPIIKEITNEL